MRKICTLSALFAVAAPVVAQKLEVQLNVFPIMKLTGNNKPVGNKYTLHQKQTADGVVPLILDYGMAYDPIVAVMQSNYAFRGEGTWRGKGRWGIGGHVSRFHTAGTIDGAVSSPKFDRENIIVNAIQMFGQSLLPLTDERVSFADVSYSAENSVRLWNGAVLGLYRMAGEEQKKLELTFGLNVAHFRNRRRDFVAETAFLYDGFSEGRHFHNDVTLDATSSLQGLFMGPTIGFRATTVVRRKISAEISFDEASLIGLARKRGVWIDIDDAWSVKGPQNGPFEKIRLEIYMYGLFSHRFNERVMVPATSVRVKSLYALNKRVAIGGGYELSAFHGMPVAPNWNVPGLWTALGGSAWQDGKRTLAKHGLFLLFQYTFNDIFK